jgi:hypothetical protein
LDRSQRGISQQEKTQNNLKIFASLGQGVALRLAKNGRQIARVFPVSSMGGEGKAG